MYWRPSVVRSCGDFISILHRLSLRWAYPFLRQTIAILLVWALILGDMPDVLTGRVNSPGERQSKHDGLVSVGHDLFSHFGLTGALAASPVIYSISPNNVPAGQTVSISGANLGSSKGTVTVAGVSANITSWGANSISFQVPGAIPTG